MRFPIFLEIRITNKTPTHEREHKQAQTQGKKKKKKKTAKTILVWMWRLKFWVYKLVKYRSHLRCQKNYNPIAATSYIPNKNQF